MNKKIAMSAVSIMTALALAGGATFAFFTDSDVSNGNSLSSGTLEVKVNDNGTSPSYVWTVGNITGLTPGAITDSSTIKVVNDSSINAAVFGRFRLSGASTPSLADELSIYNYKVDYFDDAACSIETDRWGAGGTDPYFGEESNEDWFIKDGVVHAGFTAAGGTGNLAAWVSGNGPLDIPGTAWDMEGLKPSECYIVTVQFQMDENAGNSYQGTNVTVDYQVLSGQIDADALNNLGLGAGDMTVHIPYLQSQVL